MHVAGIKFGECVPNGHCHFATILVQSYHNIMVVQFDDSEGRQTTNASYKT